MPATPYPDFSIVVSSRQQGAVHGEDRAAHTAFVAFQFMKRGKEFKAPNLEGKEELFRNSKYIRNKHLQTPHLGLVSYKFDHVEVPMFNSS